MKNKCCISLWVLVLVTNAFAWNPGMAQETKNIDVNNDGKPDVVIHWSSENTFSFKFASTNSAKEQSIHFFEEWDQSVANMSYGKKQGLLWFSIRFAPKYLDQDTLWFRFEKKRKDWGLARITSYRFNTMDPALISHTCSFALTRQLWLTKDKYDMVQQLMTNDKNKINKKCIEKQEY